MRDELLFYYERELDYIRKMGAQFAQRYPRVASRLLLEPDKCEDPHVERLIESFAFLAARVHLKIDDEFPEITEALLGILYPHFIRPTPSMAIVEFHLDPERGKLTTGLKIERDSVLYSRPVDGVPCKFRTCYETTLWPIKVVSAEWTTPDRLQPAIKSGDAAGAIRLLLRCPDDVEFHKLEMDLLRFHLTGDSSLTHALYEILNCNLTGVLLRDPTARTRVSPVTLPPSSLQPVGFDSQDGMFPYPKRSFIGYRLLQEHFVFPEKFLFVDVKGLSAVLTPGLKKDIEMIFLLSKFEGEDRRQRLEAGLSGRTFRTGCTPVVNLFPQTAEPIQVDQQKFEYRIVPDLRRPNATEVFSVDEVSGLKAQQQTITPYKPFYSFRHAHQSSQETFWIANRRLSTRANDSAYEIDLALVDIGMKPTAPLDDVVTVRMTCSNRDLPARLPFGNEKEGDFEMETGAPIKRIVALSKPTAPIRPSIGKSIQWRLLSHLSLNYLSLVENGKESLQEILKLYNFSDSAYSNRIIHGISAVKSEPRFSRVVSPQGIAFARGMKVDIEFDEEQFVGGGVYLFASVLERFLALYASLNSFSQLSASATQRKEVIRQWEPRSGSKILM